MTRLHDRVVATPDPPTSGANNPIHDSAGASAAGYSAPLVTGVRTYGWAVSTLVQALGPSWLHSGWVEFELRRPLFAGETLHIKAHLDEGFVHFQCLAGDGAQSRLVVEGRAGNGDASWLEDLHPPAIAAAEEPRSPLLSYDLSSAPLHVPLRPLGELVDAAYAKAMVTTDLGLTDSPIANSADAAKTAIHPYYLAGRMAPLTRHNFLYGPTIHVRSQIQHCRQPTAPAEIVAGAQIIEAFERNGHLYHVLDGIVSDGEGELARIRHRSIFKPRGT